MLLSFPGSIKLNFPYAFEETIFFPGEYKYFDEKFYELIQIFCLMSN